MDAKERKRLERACQVAREAGMEGEQLLLIRLDHVEEYLKLEEITKDILTAMDRLNEMRRALKAEVTDGKDRGEEQEDREST